MDAVAVTVAAVVVSVAVEVVTVEDEVDLGVAEAAEVSFCN